MLLFLCLSAESYHTRAYHTIRAELDSPSISIGGRWFRDDACLLLCDRLFVPTRHHCMFALVRSTMQRLPRSIMVQLFLRVFVQN